ncbi:hypothetical protein ABT56_00310 [Photobacterium aquae]|uniref:Uncharacterized protein n=1 Tax=Photobacterium aquae TaxID=1195763 RepID=A0A0J1K5B8_9GAMM|nr:hypothetical protein [Photobacterium aquae]KLV09567.1 hypothetical protein ABT56_00310 [Photobacterium aquae]
MSVGYFAGEYFWIEQYSEPPLPESIPFAEYGELLWGRSEYWGVRGHTAPVRQGYELLGFWERDFKNTLFISPRTVDLGFVVNPSDVPVEIWSTYTVPLSLLDLIKEGDKGLAINGPKLGAVLPPYGGFWPVTLEVSQHVEMNIDARFEWCFNFSQVAVSTTLNVVGTKVALWPYPPIYPVSESWQWFTAIVETHSGEQRLCNAELPIQFLDYRYNLPVRVAAEQTARYEAQGQNRHVVPVWTDATPPVSVRAGESEIRTDLRCRDFQPDGMAVVYLDAEHYEVAFIDKVADDVLLLKRPLTFDRRNAVVMPAIAVIAPDGLKSVRHGARAEQQIRWVNSQPLSVASPSIASLSNRPMAFTREYLGRPVVIRRGKSGGVKINIAFSWQERTTDSGQPVMIATRDLGEYSTIIDWLASGREECWQLRQLLAQFKGRLNTCWWVSFHGEIVLAGRGNRQRIAVKPTGFNRFGGRHLYLQWQDGEQCVFAMPKGVDADGNEILDIGGDATVPVEVGDLIGGHVMRLMRPDDDHVKITYRPRHQMQVSMPMREVPEGEINHGESSDGA